MICKLIYNNHGNISIFLKGVQNHRPNNLITFYKYLTAGANRVTLVIVLLIFLAGEVCTVEDEVTFPFYYLNTQGSNVTADWWISKW